MFANRSSTLYGAAAIPVLLLAAGPAYRILRNLLSLVSVVRASKGRVDTHFHALPASYLEAISAAGGDPSGYPSPEWSLEAAIESMDTLGTSVGILSVSSPGVPIAGTGEKARKLARSLNEELARYSTEYDEVKGRIGFFGVLPDWQDVDGTVAELEFLYGQQKLCSGVTVFTTYGGKLLGDPLFVPIWKKLQAYKALIFIHPSVLDVEPHLINPGIPQPILDYPLATTRTAVDLVMSGTMRACPDVDVILSHAGGALPFVGGRALSSLMLPAASKIAKISYLQAKVDFARFYYDIALSTTPAQLHGLLDFTSADHILFGSDFPYVPQFGIKTVVLGYSNFVATDPKGNEIRPEVLSQNSQSLLRKHAQGLVFQ